MASTRASTSRLSLDQWADLAPLSPQENASVQRVSVAHMDKQLPVHLQKARDDNPPTSSSSSPTPAPLHPRNTPRTRLDFSSTSLPSSRTSTPSLLPSGEFPTSTAAHPSTLTDPLSLLPLSGPITTTHQFHDFHSLVESSLEAAQEEHYHVHLSTLSAHIETCSALLSSLDAARGLLSELSANEAYVSENSSALQAACESMLEEQKHLLEVSEALTSRLDYFRELERSVRLLNEPGEEVVLRAEFLEGLDRVGVCLEYLRANRDFLDSPLYLIRFQQCLTRSMTLIKMFFVREVKRTGEEVRGKMAGKDLSEPALHALLYQKFSLLAPSLRLLLRELESRSYPSPSLSNPYSTSSSSSHSHPGQTRDSRDGSEAFDESYLPLLLECLSTYTHVRQTLLAPLLAEEVRRMDPSRAELVGLAKTGCGYLRGVAMQEWELASGFFTGGRGVAGEELYRFLSHLCDTLYDSLRPRILHEPSLSVLCDLCGVLGAVMALDSDPGLAAAAEDDEELVEGGEESEVASPGTEMGERRLGAPGGGGGGGGGRAEAVGAGAGTGLGRLRFAALVAPILQDAQTRLVFRAQAVVQAEVVGYQPRAEEVAYPERLGGGKGGKVGEQGNGDGEEDEYPTLKVTRDVLGRLERCVDRSIFLDFAAEAVSLCRSSLLTASQAIAAKGATEGVTAEERNQHAQLFLVKSLVRLKEMVGGVELVRRERGVELGEALASLLRNPTSAISSALFNPRALLSAMPNLGAEVMVDAKMDLDLSLKTACETLISLASSSLTLSLRTFLDRCTAFLSSPSSSSSPSSLAEQPWATPEEVLRLHGEWQDSVGGEAGKVVERVRMYLSPAASSGGREGGEDEEKAVRVLVPPVVEEVVETYGTFYNLIRSEYGFATSSSLVSPAGVGEKLKAATQ